MAENIQHPELRTPLQERLLTIGDGVLGFVCVEALNLTDSNHEILPVLAASGAAGFITGIAAWKIAGRVVQAWHGRYDAPHGLRRT